MKVRESGTKILLQNQLNIYSLSALVRYGQAQKGLQINSKPFLPLNSNFIFKGFSIDLTD